MRPSGLTGPVRLLRSASGDGPDARLFADPPRTYRPWAYWWWLNGHVDRPQMTADLEDIRRLGFGGVQMFDSRGYWDDDQHCRMEPAVIDFMSERWFDNVAFGLRECDRLGLEFTMNLNSGKLKFLPGRLFGRLEV